MVSKTFAICFYLKKRPGESQRTTPIYSRITVDGKRAEISTNRCCDEPEKWNASSGRMIGNRESTKILNAHLQALQNKVYEIYKSLLVEDAEITAELIKNKLTGIAERCKGIMEVFQEHNDQMKELINIQFAPATYKRCKTSLEHTKEFIQWKFKVADIPIKKLN